MIAKIDTKNCKRKFPRIQKEMEGQFWVLEAEKKKEMLSSRTATIGRGGLMFVSSVPISVDTHLKVRLYDENHDITFLSRVVWTKPVEKNQSPGYFIGIQFDPPQQVSLLHIDFLLQNEQSEGQEVSGPDLPV